MHVGFNNRASDGRGLSVFNYQCEATAWEGGATYTQEGKGDFHPDPPTSSQCLDLCVLSCMTLDNKQLPNLHFILFNMQDG